MRIFAGEWEKRNLGSLWSFCLSSESQRIDFFFFSLLQVLIFLLDILGSAFQTWLILSISWDLPLEIYVPEVRVALTTALEINLEPIHFIWPLSTLQSSLNCKVLEMGVRVADNPFWPSPVLQIISSCLAQLPWDNETSCQEWWLGVHHSSVSHGFLWHFSKMAEYFRVLRQTLVIIHHHVCCATDLPLF